MHLSGHLLIDMITSTLNKPVVMTIFWVSFKFSLVFLYKTISSLSVLRCINNILQHHLEKYI